MIRFRYVHGLILFVVASQALTERTDGRGLALGLGALFLVRGAIQGGSGLYLDGDLGPLLVMTLPLVWWAGIELRGIASRMLIAAMVIAMLTLVVATENRGAAVALGVVVLTVMWQLMRRFRYVLLVAPLVLAPALALVPASYTHRFAAIWDQTLSHPTAGLDRATVAERLDLWSAGIKMTLAHPVFGVGPGNYPNLINSLVVSGNENLPAHNSLVNIAAESGLPGLVLFVTLFAAIGILLVGVIRKQHVGWRVSAAWSLLASLLAYLAAGLFISRQDMPLAYLLLGWGFAIAVVGPRQCAGGPIASPRGARH